MCAIISDVFVKLFNFRIIIGFFLDLARSSAKNDKNGELQRTDITDRTTEKVSING